VNENEQEKIRGQIARSGSVCVEVHRGAEERKGTVERKKTERRETRRKKEKKKKEKVRQLGKKEKEKRKSSIRCLLETELNGIRLVTEVCRSRPTTNLVARDVTIFPSLLVTA
jgi:hypothetical protein